MSAFSRISVYFFAIASAAIAFAVPLLLLYRTPGFDWTYFNALSLVVRSSVLHYFSLPLHNPWACGGMDVFANPQSRIFSPLGLFDIAFPPEWANLFSLIFCCLFGFIGMYRLLTQLDVKHRSSIVGAFIYVNASFFGLHFAEGHITFGPILLLPWSLFFFIRWNDPKSFFSLCFLQVFFIHTGAIYAFIFSVLLCVLYLIAFPTPAQWTFKPSIRTVGLYSLILITSVFFALVKGIPILFEHGMRKPTLDFTSIPIQEVVHLLTGFAFSPQNELFGLPYRAHEFACHFSWLGGALILLFFPRKNFCKSNYRYFLLVLFWLIVAFGIGGSLNPWILFQKLPLINNAHVQSRLVILAYIFFVVLIARVMSILETRKTVWFALATILLVEAGYVRNYPVYSAMSYWSFEAPTADLIQNETVRANVGVGWEMRHYFSGNSSKTCYEPALPSGLPHFSGKDWDKTTLVKEGAGEVQLLAYTPGRITLTYEARSALAAQINTNYLSGWRITDGEGTITPSKEGLLNVNIPSGSGTLKLGYSPRYLPIVYASLILGLLGLFWLKALGLWKHKPHFQYETIPAGYYDRAFHSSGNVRRHWHQTKFRRVLDLFPESQNESILDIGCAAGTFLGLVSENRFPLQVGVDLSRPQIEYANAHYGTPFRRFIPLDYPTDLRLIGGQFDVITLIEVIEHLDEKEITQLLNILDEKLKTGGKLVITTPNYFSVWPLLEFWVNLISDVGYWDQHITKFNSFTIEKDISKLIGSNKDNFEIEFKTTSHFLTPFLAFFSPSRAEHFSRAIDAQKWRNPFGCISMIVLKKTAKGTKNLREAV